MDTPDNVREHETVVDISPVTEVSEKKDDVSESDQESNDLRPSEHVEHVDSPSITTNGSIISNNLDFIQRGHNTVVRSRSYYQRGSIILSRATDQGTIRIK